MKRTQSLLVRASLVLVMAAWAVTGFSQNCEAYFPMKSGTSFETSSYSAKDKLQSVVTTTITEKENTGDHIVSTAHAVVKDNKGKETGQVDYTVTCAGGEFKMDMRAMAGGMQMPQGLEGMEMHIEADEMVIPTQMTPGASLPDAHFSMKATMNGMQLMSTSVTSTNRKYVKNESITTPAGTFECILIESDSEVNSMGMHFQTHDKSWYALGTGMVRQESYKNGALESYQVLTKFSK